MHDGGQAQRVGGPRWLSHTDQPTGPCSLLKLFSSKSQSEGGGDQGAACPSRHLPSKSPGTPPHLPAEPREPTPAYAWGCPTVILFARPATLEGEQAWVQAVGTHTEVTAFRELPLSEGQGEQGAQEGCPAGQADST